MLAVRLFAEIEKAFKKRPPLSGLFQEPTIEHLATLITQENPTTTPTSLVVIQPNGSKPPFFCVHELFGDVLCYLSLARHLGEERPFYALQARGLNNGDEPFDDLEMMAAYYIDQIRTVQPRGPYALGGLCIGGVIAFEMAQQLKAKGESVSLLALLDSGIKSGPSRAAWWRTIPVAIPSWLTGARQLNASQWLALAKLKHRQFKAKLANTLWPRNGNSRKDRHSTLVNEMADLLGFSEQHRKIAYAQYQAIKKYRPETYGGPLTLFKAQMQPLFSSHRPDKGWRRFAAGGLDINVVPGNHSGMLQEPHVRILAEKLRAYLDAAALELKR